VTTTTAKLVVATTPLAFTGADLSVLIALAAAAIAVGGILVLGSRRKVRAQK
jgi:hypothetical protein